MLNITAGGRLPATATALAAAIFISACGGGADPSSSQSRQNNLGIPEGESLVGPNHSLKDKDARIVTPEEDNGERPVDYGEGPVLAPDTPLRDGPIDVGNSMPPLINGGPEAHITGTFGKAFPFPVIPIHMVMLPDGRILAYGSDEKGMQGGQLHYVVYDPAPEASPFLVLSNSTGTDIFCSTNTLLPQDGTVMLAGGDRIENGVRNYANGDVNVFDPTSGILRKQAQSMAYRRWYGTSLITAEGEHLVLGGRDDRPWGGAANAAPTVSTYSTTPEIYHPARGWRTLPGAKSDAAFGENHWNGLYPKAWVAPNGQVIVLSNGNSIFQLDTAGQGNLQTWLPLSGELLPGWGSLPAVMFAPGKILAARNRTQAQVIDINGPQPVVLNTAPMSIIRVWGSMTLLPDGQVWANGGSSDGKNELASAVYTSEIWNPRTGTWRKTASASKPRLYHGNAILLRDGTVLTGGGGAPGPVRGLNAEIFYPPYLFKKDGSGEMAARPKLTSISSRSLSWSEKLSLQMSNTERVQRITMLRTSAATHSFNGDQRLLELNFVQNGTELQADMPNSRNNAPPGYYMIFVINQEGVPSVAEIVKLG